MTSPTEHAAGLAVRLHAFVVGFYRALDQGDDRVVANCFAPDGEWNRKGATLTGSQAVLSALEERDPGRKTVHAISNFTCLQQGLAWQTRYTLCVYDNDSSNNCRLAMILDCTDTIGESGGDLVIHTKKSARLLPTPG